MHWILVYFFLFSTQAAPLSEALTQYADRPALYGVLTDFLALSKIFRLSGHEAGVREWIAEQAKKNDRSFQTDAAGNITVHVPGTGRFLKTKNAIALQGHMDMVPGVKNLKPGETVEDYFKRPLDLVVDSGWIFSRDHLTTVGADDGIGLALMLRYLKPTQVEHPPLELIFTADEENEMTGAQGLTLSPALRALINLDLDEFGHAATGCQGDGNATATFSALNETPPLLRARGVRIHLHGLLGATPAETST